VSAPVVVVDEAGATRAVVPRTARDRATVSAWLIGVGHFLTTGDASLLARLAGRRVGYLELATDLAVIETAARVGAL